VIAVAAARAEAAGEPAGTDEDAASPAGFSPTTDTDTQVPRDTIIR
jgi:hypothetical protein